MKITRWIVSNLIYIFLLFLGIYMGYDWAFNIAMFLTWLGIVFSFAVFSPNVRKDLPKDMLSVPVYVNTSVDIIILLFFVANGFFVTAVFWFVRTLLLNGTYKMLKEEVANVYGS